MGKASQRKKRFSMLEHYPEARDVLLEGWKRTPEGNRLFFIATWLFRYAIESSNGPEWGLSQNGDPVRMTTAIANGAGLSHVQIAGLRALDLSIHFLRQLRDLLLEDAEIREFYDAQGIERGLLSIIVKKVAPNAQLSPEITEALRPRTLKLFKGQQTQLFRNNNGEICLTDAPLSERNRLQPYLDELEVWDARQRGEIVKLAHQTGKKRRRDWRECVAKFEKYRRDCPTLTVEQFIRGYLKFKIEPNTFRQWIRDYRAERARGA